MTNNSSKTETHNIINQVIHKCNCNNHNPDDYECACKACLVEQIQRLEELIKGEK